MYCKQNCIFLSWTE